MAVTTKAKTKYFSLTLARKDWAYTGFLAIDPNNL